MECIKLDYPIRAQSVEIIEPFISSLCGIKDYNEYVFHGVILLSKPLVYLRGFRRVYSQLWNLVQLRRKCNAPRAVQHEVHSNYQPEEKDAGN